MKHCPKFLAVSTALLLPATASLTVTRDGTDGKGMGNPAKVCYPEVNGSGVVPPCISISNIESACQPNGTESIDFNAHAQCMCQGSYFVDWRGCQNCLFIHGFRSARDHVYWERVLSVASDSLCQGTPTAAFSAIFSSVQANTRDAPFVTTGDTMSSDKFPSKTDVSLYYTATGPQGPGAITGAAATATRVSNPSATNLTASNTSGNSNKNTPSRTGSGSASENASITRPSSSTSTGGAPAQGTGMAMAIAGAALVLAL
ncbi:collagen-like protein Mcl1, partial [Metarhizium majus ARSEF 297]